jgi:hypothetical protein
LRFGETRRSVERQIAEGGADGRWHARVTVGRRLDGERDRRHLSRATRRELDAAIRELENDQQRDFRGIPGGSRGDQLRADTS